MAREQTKVNAEHRSKQISNAVDDISKAATKITALHRGAHAATQEAVAVEKAAAAKKAALNAKIVAEKAAAAKEAALNAKNAAVAAAKKAAATNVATVTSR